MRERIRREKKLKEIVALRKVSVRKGSVETNQRHRKSSLVKEQLPQINLKSPELKDSLASPLVSKKRVQIQDFEVLGAIGEGAFGKVYHVVRKDDGLQFALKTIRKEKVKSVSPQILTI